MDKQTSELVSAWREMGPAAWCESPYGWAGVDGQPVQLAPWQRAVLAAWFALATVITTLAISNVKKSGKTWINAVLTCWRWLALPGLHFCVANDLDQSTSRQFQEIADMVKRHPYLSQVVKVQARQLEYTPTGSILLALAGDASGNAGANFLTVSHTEAWGVMYESDIRNWEELTTPPGLFYGLPALRIADSYAGHLDESNTWHDLVDRSRGAERVDKDWPVYQAGGLLLFHMQGQEAQQRCFRGTPAMAAGYYSEQKKSLRENAYRRLHLNERTAAVGGFLDQDAWEALIDRDHKPLPAGSPQAVYIGLDLALAPGGDNCALIGLYAEARKVKVAFHQVWQGGKLRLKKLSIADTILPYILDLKKKYNVYGVYFDPWQAQFLAEKLEQAGIRCYEVRQTHQSRGPRDTRLFEMATSGELVLYNDSELKNAAANAAAKELPDGRLFLTKGGRGKIDLLVAMSNAAFDCMEAATGRLGMRVLPNPFYGAYAGMDIQRDFYYLLDGSGFIALTEQSNRKPHPPGVTWRNCLHRTKGCLSCCREMDESGEYTRQREEAKLIAQAGTPTNPDSIFGPSPKIYDEQRSKDNELLKKFHNQVRRRLAG